MGAKKARMNANICEGVRKYVRPGTEEEWAERCGAAYIPVGAAQYAAELGSDSDEANDAKARRRGCMEQRMNPPKRATKGRPKAAQRTFTAAAPAQNTAAAPAQNTATAAAPAPIPVPETPPFGAVFSVCRPNCGHSFEWPPGPAPDSDTETEGEVEVALGDIQPHLNFWA